MGSISDGHSFWRKMVSSRDSDTVVFWICCGFRFWLVVELEVSNRTSRAYYFEKLKNEETSEKNNTTSSKRLALG